MPRICALIAFLLVSVRDVEAAECRADFNGSGAVEVNEVIQVVNEALGGCGGSAATPTRPAATPTRTPTVAPSTCPYKFNQAVSPDLFCGYDGNLTSGCAPFPVGSAWTTSGTDVIALLVDNNGDSLAVAARRTSPTTAKVSSISFSPNFDESFTATGTVSLPSTSRLKVTFNAGGSCGTFVHDGTFASLIGDNAQTARAQTIGDLRAALRTQSGAAVSAAVGDDRLARIRALARSLRP